MNWEKMSVTILVPMVPPSGNQMRRKYRDRFNYRDLRDAWQRTIHALIQGNNKAWLEAMARDNKAMEMFITVEHMRKYDRDNLISGVKMIPDSYQRLGFLAGDDEARLKLHVDQTKGRMNETRICVAEYMP